MTSLSSSREPAGESPIHLAKRLGIMPAKNGCEAATYDLILQWAVLAYWRKRGEQGRRARAA